MLTEDQLIDRLRAALERETEGIEPPSHLLANVHRELLATPAAGRMRGRRSKLGGGLLIALASTAAVAVVVAALTIVGHKPAPSPAPASSRIPAGTARIIAHAPDPRGGRQWGLRMVQTNSVSTCLQVGRVESGTLGGIGQDGAFSNDGRFHPLSPRAAGPGLCTGDDAHGNAYMNVVSIAVPASAAPPSGVSGGCRVGPAPIRRPACPRGDLRNLAYGLLGPDAVSITYLAPNGHSATVPTGLDGAYLVVLPGTTEFCTAEGPGGRGRGCIGGAGEMTTGGLQSGVITAVRYRDGHVCTLPAPTRSGTKAASCPGVGYTAVPFHAPHVAASQVAAPVTARAIVARQYCYRPATQHDIACDHGVPRGYKRGASGVHPPELLIDIGFTARLAATNGHSVYEWSLTESPNDPNCPGGGGGTDATTMTPIRAGQHVVQQTFASTCPGTYTGLVTYQPNGWPGRDTLHAGAPIRDGSVLVGRFSFTVH